MVPGFCGLIVLFDRCECWVCLILFIYRFVYVVYFVMFLGLCLISLCVCADYGLLFDVGLCFF